MAAFTILFCHILIQFLYILSIIGATTVWNPWDASHPTLEIAGPAVLGSLQLLQIAVIYSLGTMGNLL